jgi:AcrR family transcriptional regulator
MPRTPDPKLQARILEAARQLFAKGGEHRLSMRALARLAGTNTPAVYRRFRDRDAILEALVQQFRQNAFAVLQPCRSPEEMAHAMLGLALKSPQIYELYYTQLIKKIPGERPNFEFTKKRCAAWLGGSAEDYSGLVLALFAMVHGTAMLLISKAVRRKNEAKMRAAFSASVQLLLRNADALR